MLKKKRLKLCLASVILGFLAVATGCSSGSLPNYSAEGACNSLDSLINQLGLMEIRDTSVFYAQMQSIAAQARTAATQNPEFAEMASQVESFARVWADKFPNGVPNYLGTVPLQVTAEDFCGFDYSDW